MALTAVDKIIDRATFSAELKFDGFRGLFHGNEQRIISRQGNDLTGRFPELAGVGKLFNERAAIVDGEIVAFNENHEPDFALLQGRKTKVVYVAFDILAYDGESLVHLALRDRRERLADLIREDSARLIRSRSFASAVALLAETEARRLEGIVVKDDNSPYVEGPRKTRHWLKIKTSHGKEEDERRQITFGHRKRDDG